MNPSAAIAMLDRQLAAHGQAVTLRRPAGTGAGVTFTDAAVNAFVRGYAPAELVGGIAEGDTQVTVSPTALAALSWPVPPKRHDKIVVSGRTCEVMAVAPVWMGGSVVRYDIRVRG